MNFTGVETAYRYIYYLLFMGCWDYCRWSLSLTASRRSKADVVRPSCLIKKADYSDAMCRSVNTRSNHSVLDTEGHTSLYGIY